MHSGEFLLLAMLSIFEKNLAAFDRLSKLQLEAARTAADRILQELGPPQATSCGDLGAQRQPEPIIDWSSRLSQCWRDLMSLSIELGAAISGLEQERQVSERKELAESFENVIPEMNADIQKFLEMSKRYLFMPIPATAPIEERTICPTDAVPSTWRRKSRRKARFGQQ